MMHKLCLILAVGFAGVGYGQLYSSSPFSTQGLGEAGGLEDAQFGGIGTTRTSVIDSATVNLYNPSSYVSLSKGQPLFSIGLSSHLSRYTYQGSSSDGRVVGLNQIALAMSVSKRFGLAMGLQPFSRRGYTIEMTVQEGTDSIRYKYSGSGSTQEVFGGLSYRLLNLRRHQLAFGANYSYIFGTVTNQRLSSFVEYDPIGGADENSYRLHGTRYTTGMNYLIMLDTASNQFLRLAATFSPQQKLNAHRDYLLYTSTDITNPNDYDTLVSSLSNKGTITYPASMSFGFTYSFRPRISDTYRFKHQYQLNVYGEYNSTLWSQYATSFNGEHITGAFKDAHRFSAGVQFIPNSETFKSNAGSSYFNRVRYRAGTYFGTMPNTTNGTQLSEYGVTVGLGLPSMSQRSNSTFNISILYGQRGGNIPQGMKEQFLSFNLGLIIAPSSYDRWFKKYKLD